MPQIKLIGWDPQFKQKLNQYKKYDRFYEFFLGFVSRLQKNPKTSGERHPTQKRVWLATNYCVQERVWLTIQYTFQDDKAYLYDIILTEKKPTWFHRIYIHG